MALHLNRTPFDNAGIYFTTVERAYFCLITNERCNRFSIVIVFNIEVQRSLACSLARSIFINQRKKIWFSNSTFQAVSISAFRNAPSNIWEMWLSKFERVLGVTCDAILESTLEYMPKNNVCLQTQTDPNMAISTRATFIFLNCITKRFLYTFCW